MLLLSSLLGLGLVFSSCSKKEEVSSVTTSKKKTTTIVTPDNGKKKKEDEPKPSKKEEQDFPLIGKTFKMPLPETKIEGNISYMYDKEIRFDNKESLTYTEVEERIYLKTDKYEKVLQFEYKWDKSTNTIKVGRLISKSLKKNSSRVTSKKTIEENLKSSIAFIRDSKFIANPYTAALNISYKGKKYPFLIK